MIQTIVPTGVIVNVPPFLGCGKLTKPKIIKTKHIVACRIYVERVNARLKCFKILTSTPSWLRSNADTIFQVVAALVILQFPLVKEAWDDNAFE